MTKGFHHVAYRCKDTHETVNFYNKILKFPIAHTLLINETKTKRKVNVLHIFFKVGINSYLAFFDYPLKKFNFKKQHDFDLHFAILVSKKKLKEIIKIANLKKLKIRGPSNHEFIESIYLRDPNGYVVEFTVKTSIHDEVFNRNPLINHKLLNNWKKFKKIDNNI